MPFFSAAISTCRIQELYFQHAFFHSFNMPLFVRSRFNMPDFFSTCRIQELHFSTCRFYNFNMPFFSAAISTCQIQELHFSTCLFSFLHHAVFFCSNFNMPDSGTPFFNMPFFIPWTCRFFLQQFQHAGFRNSILQLAFFHSFNMPSFIRSSFNMLVFFQHAGFSQQHPFSTCRFYTFNMPFFPRAISTCRIQEHVHFTNTACTAC